MKYNQKIVNNLQQLIDRHDSVTTWKGTGCVLVDKQWIVDLESGEWYEYGGPAVWEDDFNSAVTDKLPKNDMKTVYQEYYGV